MVRFKMLEGGYMGRKGEASVVGNSQPPMATVSLMTSQARLGILSECGSIPVADACNLG